MRQGEGRRDRHRQQVFHGLAWCLGLLILLGAAPAGFADGPPPPAYFVLPPQGQLKPNWIQEDYGLAEFVIQGQDNSVQFGRHWHGSVIMSGEPDGTDLEVMWAKQLKPPLVGAGWVFFPDLPGQAKTARYQKNGKNSWLIIWLQGTDDIRYDIVEAGPLPANLRVTLPQPAAKPETIDVEHGDFPYFPHIPGLTYQGGSHDDAPMMLEVDLNQTDSETRLVAQGSITKSYSAPQALQSPAVSYTVYHDALLQAGWTIVHQSKNLLSADMVISAHYTANGRDLWAYLHGGGETFSIQVGDNGAQDIGKQLDKDCHVALYGINFDFNKATLRPDSNPTLEKVLALVKSRPDLKLEVQGHTDNVGSDEYNLKLSDARAASVVAWLVSKGIAASRLTAHGYGLRVPIADNGSDEGRAKNRRVELKKQGCGQ
jgi:outer membrane protein OmpA-like peptidoglycan-associated protein